ncbi:Peptidyl-prolyl isomerase cwc-27 [Pseudocercospora fuligena]|uniref:Peptidyl-prolyl isomerase cwc-27 n=1 Tax=Pseudocercospora fuligena TaxID=685502 RepID=A0A8H6VII6_9PEZI|nr:Peptidyl-prolyl isomerase cwc-27 [Pseudocercospora fuligena]
MANLYNLEPQPTAKVVLNTTAGDLTIELFAKQTPLASRNFLQHCLDGYYNNTIFHRLVPGFIIQGGDPTGTGSGGVSAVNDGEPFQDEFHSRLKFNRRGLLGMANEGPSSNGSQFFFTLDQTPELQGKNTMFGRIEGDTIYNLMKMTDKDLVGLEEGSERPLYPTKVTGAEILVNPFEDMVARVKEAPRTKAESKKPDAKKRKKPAGKNVMSFGGEEEEEAAPVLKKAKANPKLVAAEEEDAKPAAKIPKEKKAKKDIVEEPAQPETEPETTRPAQEKNSKEEDEEEEESDSEPEDREARRRQKVLEDTNAQIAQLKASMKRTVDTKPKEKDKPNNALEAMIPATSTRGRKRGKASDEQGAFDLFKSFKARLEDLPEDKTSADPVDAPQTKAHEDSNGDKSALPTTAEPDNDDEAELCDLHFIANCQSCKAWDEEKPDGDAEADGDDDPGWMAHTLSFVKDTLGKDLQWKEQMKQIEVIDPKEKARALKEERRKERDHKGKDKVRDRR